MKNILKIALLASFGFLGLPIMARDPSGSSGSLCPIEVHIQKIKDLEEKQMDDFYALKKNFISYCASNADSDEKRYCMGFYRVSFEKHDLVEECKKTKSSSECNKKCLDYFNGIKNTILKSDIYDQDKKEFKLNEVCLFNDDVIKFMNSDRYISCKINDECDYFAMIDKHSAYHCKRTGSCENHCLKEFYDLKIENDFKDPSFFEYNDATIAKFSKIHPVLIMKILEPFCEASKLQLTNFTLFCNDLREKLPSERPTIDNTCDDLIALPDTYSVYFSDLDKLYTHLQVIHEKYTTCVSSKENE
jgi:hypothetical protein